eukprot:symbB.v1.2.002316.t1/scaffold123.1/size315817/1
MFLRRLLEAYFLCTIAAEQCIDGEDPKPSEVKTSCACDRHDAHEDKSVAPASCLLNSDEPRVAPYFVKPYAKMPTELKMLEDNQFWEAQPAYYANATDSSGLSKCPEGFARLGKAPPEPVPAGSYLYKPTLLPKELYHFMGCTQVRKCPQGYYCKKGQPPKACGKGSLCSTTGLSRPRPCPEGYYCPTSLFNLKCFKGSFCPPKSQVPRSCRKGYYCPNPCEEVICPAGGRAVGDRELQAAPCTPQAKAPDGDEVKVSYSLLVGGEQLQTAGTDGLTFTIGAAEVLPQLSLVVQQMYQGEHAEFTMDVAMLQDSGISYQGSTTTAQLQVELVTCPLREDLFGDQGAIKRTIKSSEGRLPKNGDECQVSYTISSEGKETLSSGHEAVYKIGAPNQLGQLAQIIDRSLLSMKLKEEVLVICRPGYEIFQVHDVSLGKHDGTVLRKRLKEGSGPHRLHDTGKVQVRVWTVTSNSEKVSSRPFDLTFVAGEGEACDALEGAVLGLKAGDELMLRVMDPATCEAQGDG